MLKLIFRLYSKSRALLGWQGAALFWGGILLSILAGYATYRRVLRQDLLAIVKETSFLQYSAKSHEHFLAGAVCSIASICDSTDKIDEKGLDRLWMTLSEDRPYVSGLFVTTWDLVDGEAVHATAWAGRGGLAKDFRGFDFLALGSRFPELGKGTEPLVAASTQPFDIATNGSKKKLVLVSCKVPGGDGKVFASLIVALDSKLLAESMVRDGVVASSDVWIPSMEGDFPEGGRRTTGSIDWFGHRVEVQFKAPASHLILAWIEALAVTLLVVVLSFGAILYLGRSKYVLRMLSSAREKADIEVKARIRVSEEKMRLEERMVEDEKLASLGLMASGVAHDFNNLLQGITGYASLIEIKASTGEDVTGSVESVLQIAQRCGEMCKRLLDYAGNEPMDMQVFDLSQAVREAVTMVKMGVDKKARLKYVAPSESMSVYADAARINQIILNLIMNGAEALEGRAGDINISLKRTMDPSWPEADLRHNFQDDTHHEDGWVVLEVADSGCGMTSDTLKRIFTPFYTTKPKGRGLGLSAMIGIVRSHHGIIKCRSRVGQGTSFRVYLPHVHARSNSLPPDVDLSSRKYHGKVLVVDDESLVTDFLTDKLSLMGFKVHIARDGKEGVDLFERHPDASLALIDHTMPEMDGMELLNRVRAMGIKTPVIRMSGYSSQAAARITDEPDTYFLPKPFSGGQLSLLIARVIPHAQEKEG